MAIEKFPVEAGHIMMFARAIGDANPIYYDENYAKTTEPGGVIAPPTFVQSGAQFDPDYFCAPRSASPGSDPERADRDKPGSAGDGGGGGRGLHANSITSTIALCVRETCLRHRFTGKKWEKEGKRSES